MFRKASILAGCGAAGSSTGESASSSGSAQSEAQSQSEEDSGAQTEISGESESASFRAEEGKTSVGCHGGKRKICIDFSAVL